jgi:hypothetical protein
VDVRRIIFARRAAEPLVTNWSTDPPAAFITGPSKYISSLTRPRPWEIYLPWAETRDWLP